MNRSTTSPDTAAATPAERRVNALADLSLHLAIYATVNTLLFLLDLFDGNGLWFFWPLGGWGIGVAAHVATVAAGAGSSWRERKVQAMVAREAGR